MSSTIQTRLKELARECGGNRALCEKSGVSERTFANWIAGTSEPKIIGMAAIADSAGVTLDWIVSGHPPKLKFGAREGMDENVIKLACLDQELSNEDLPLTRRLRVTAHHPFSRVFLTESLGLTDFEDLCLFHVNGDSMAPTMDDQDLVLIDGKQKTLNDGLFVYVFNNRVFIKRLHTVLGGIQVLSDNSAYPTQVINAEDLDQFQVLGRIIWVGKIL